MELGIGAAIGAAVVIFFVVAAATVRAGGAREAVQGLTISGMAKRDPAFAAKVKALLGGAEIKPTAPPAPPAPPKPSGVPLRMLAMLQAESRLVDFLLEDIQALPDAQIGQAVREVHKKAQAALRQHAVIEPVLGGKEDEAVTVPRGFDPSAIRVIGNVTGEPPFNGQIQHPGWKVTELKLSPLPQGTNEFILQPAEVQIA